MTPFPYSIDADATLAEGQAMMERHGVRHLPVTEGKRLVGIVTDRDIRQSLDPVFDMPPLQKIRTIMVDDPYVVAPDEPLDSVLLTLAERRIGCVLVAAGGQLEGIFTTTDASRMLGEHYRATRSTRDDDPAS
jgi:acetoin utilization protein AcuB